MTFMDNLLDRITSEPGKMGGRPCIRGLRIRVVDILDLLAAGLTHAEIVEELEAALAQFTELAASLPVEGDDSAGTLHAS